jgi:hypothetical protein
MLYSQHMAQRLQVPKGVQGYLASEEAHPLATKKADLR